MSYVERNLMPGERIVHRARVHWAGYVAPATLAAVLVAAGVAFRVPVAMLGVAAIVCLPWWIAVHLKRSSCEFVVTDRRVAIKVGLFSHRSEELLLDRIEGVQVVQGFMDRLLDRGSLVFTGTGGNRTELKNVWRPLEFRRGVQVGIEALERSRRDRADVAA